MVATLGDLVTTLGNWVPALGNLVPRKLAARWLGGNRKQVTRWSQEVGGQVVVTGSK